MAELTEADIQAAMTPAEAADPDREICKTTQVTGSLIARNEVCQSAREWAVQRASNRDWVRDFDRGIAQDDPSRSGGS